MRLAQHGCQKVIAAPILCLKLVEGINRRIHFAAKVLLRVRHRFDHVVHRNVTDDDQVKIACSPQCAACSGSEDDCRSDLLRVRRERPAQDIGGARGFQQEALQLGKNRRLPVSLKVHLPPLDRTTDDSSADKGIELPLHPPEGGTGLTGDLTHVIGLVGVSEEPRKDQTARAAEQHRAEIRRIGRLLRTQNAYICTHFEYGWQAASFSNTKFRVECFRASLGGSCRASSRDS